MAKWTFERTATLGGRFQIIITKPGHPPTDVSMLRGAPAQLSSYTNADPFGDATAQITFPMLSGFDDLDSHDVGAFLGDFADVDIWWLPATAAEPGTGDVLSPLSNAPDVTTPVVTGTGAEARTKVWEGFIASIELSADDAGSSISVQCQGALFQADRYMQKPFFPPRPQPLEALLAGVFDRATKPHLRTGPLVTTFPAGWSKVVPAVGVRNSYTPDAKPGAKWTGYASRHTGGWERSLTGYCAGLLAVMLTQADCGATPGNQWTIGQRRAASGVAGRAPVLYVRDRFRASDFTLWLGTPGVSISLTRDGSQVANIIYGDGTSIDGTVWRNAVISADGSRTDYAPLAAAAEVWPYTNNPRLDRSVFAAEAHLVYEPGFNADDALTSAAQTLARDRDPGWSGTLDLKIDPGPDLSRFLLRAGMTVTIAGVAGTGERGLNFHIAEVSVNGTDGTVSCKIDTRYRDLLNLEEALLRNRDPLTPAKLLQVGQAHLMIEDVQAPWDYTAGSGFIPKASVPFHRFKPSAEPFPYTSWAATHPPFHFPSYYIRINANAARSADRWTQRAVPFLTSEKGTVRRTEICCYDKHGQVLAIPFHCSIYYVNLTVTAMPHDGTLGYSAYINNAFEKINPATGVPWGTAAFLGPQPSLVIGWGNRQNGVYQRAGFSPGRETDGDHPTGMLVDESDWSFDNTRSENQNWNPYLKLGAKQKESAISLYVMLYAEHTEPVYFMGRLYRTEPGTG